MRYVLPLAIVAALLVGCEKKNTPQTSTQVPEKSYEEIAPQAPEPVVYEEPAPTPPAPKERTYTIKKGDTLWSIAVAELGSGKRYKEIEELNPGIKANALRIGTTIKLPAE